MPSFFTQLFNKPTVEDPIRCCVSVRRSDPGDQWGIYNSEEGLFFTHSEGRIYLVSRTAGRDEILYSKQADGISKNGIIDTKIPNMYEFESHPGFVTFSVNGSYEDAVHPDPFIRRLPKLCGLPFTYTSGMIIDAITLTNVKTFQVATHVTCAKCGAHTWSTPDGNCRQADWIACSLRAQLRDITAERDKLRKDLELEIE